MTLSKQLKQHKYIPTPSGYKKIKEICKPKIWQKILYLFGIEVIKVKFA